jgi:hypothetical protein
VRIGAMLAYTPLDEKSLALLLNYLQDFLKWVQPLSWIRRYQGSLEMVSILHSAFQATTNLTTLTWQQYNGWHHRWCTPQWNNATRQSNEKSCRLT